jgi:hypothetical protein
MFRPILTAARLARRIPKRELWTTIPKHNRYVRFSDGKASRHSPNKPFDWRTLSPPVKFGAVLFAFGTVFYISQCAIFVAQN